MSVAESVFVFGVLLIEDVVPVSTGVCVRAGVSVLDWLFGFCGRLYARCFFFYFVGLCA